MIDILQLVVAPLAALVAYLLTARKYDRLINRIVERTEERDRALQKQAKAYAQRAAQTERAAAKMVDRANAALSKATEIREDARSVKADLNTMLSDPRLQRFLNREGGE